MLQAMSETQIEEKQHKKDIVSGKIQGGSKFVYDDYDMACSTLAKKLLGHYLCRRLESGEEVKGIIVETEAYLGGDDKASHSFDGRKTERNAAMYMRPGTAYVYSTYGMYFCLNISSKGDGAAVLIRSLEPISGLETMKISRERNQRSRISNNKKKPITKIDLCNGPAKLCMSFEIDKSLNKFDMVESNKLWIERPTNLDSTNLEHSIVACPRIGIAYAGKDWLSKPLRFYLSGNPFVSKRDKEAEQKLSLNI